MSLLDGNAAARKSAPIASGVLWYFPNALALVANLSLISNLRHNGDGPRCGASTSQTITRTP